MDQMDHKFLELTESLHGSFEKLLALQPCSDGNLPKVMPLRGVYLFSESGAHLYVGRSNGIRKRYKAHTLPSSKQYSAAFAMLLARKATGRKASYRQGSESRTALMTDSEFCKVFEEQKRRIRRMDFRWVEESRPLQQTLLEVYCAVVLQTIHNDFDNH